MSSRPYFITTPIYYANAPLHVGSAFEIVGIDIVARYHRLLGEDVLFLTGMDEHGEKNQRAAEKRGITPQQHVDEMAANFEDFCRRLGISCDDLIRTTQPRHLSVVDAFWRKVRDNGDIYLGQYAGAYCQRCESYVKETDLRDGNCPTCGDPTRPLSEPAYFFRLSRYEDALKTLYAERPDFVKPDFRRNEMLAMLESGLDDVCISRSSITWGIPVPDAPGHVVYVWFDALVNYISALGCFGDDARFARYWPADLHVVGKDILRWHALLWPAMLMAAGLPPPKQIFGHGFIYVKGDKMSKSLGNVVDPRGIVEKYGADALRFFLMRDTPYGSDGNYSEAALLERYNADLANDLGNLVMRTLSMIGRYRDARVPDAGGEASVLAGAAEALRETVPPLIATLQFNRALEQVWELVRRANRFVEERQPWTLAKDPQQAARLDATLYDLAEAVRVLSAWLEPFMPHTAAAIREQLGLGPIEPPLADAVRWGRLAPGQAVRRGAPLFPRIEPAAVE